MLLARLAAWQAMPGTGLLEATPQQLLTQLAALVLEVGLGLGFLVMNSQRLERELRASEAALRLTVTDLERARAEVRTLGGLLPICASCKKIRDDKGYWKVVEAYLAEHTEATFTHGVCPDCYGELYSEEQIERELGRKKR